MSDEIPEDRPINLRDLAAEESPDVVRVALQRFRRRTAVRAVWLAGLVLAVLLVLPMLSPERSLAERYYTAPGAAIGLAADAGPIRVVLIDGRRIDPETGGLHFVATTSEARSEVLIIDVVAGESSRSTGSIYSPGVAGGPSAEAFVSFPLDPGAPPERVIVTVAHAMPGSLPGQPITVTFDLSALTTLHQFWR
jgi:hypothetical protein